jgi:hypothetical protein
VTTGHDRDRVVDELLRRTLRSQASTPSPEDCPDAETLAAWFDGGLDERARTLVMSHASACARCQAALGVLARTAPVTVTVPWWRRQWKAWLVPVTAAATAATLWMVVPGQRESMEVSPTRPAAEAGVEGRQAQERLEPRPDAANSASASAPLTVGSRVSEAARPGAATEKREPAPAGADTRERAQADRLVEKPATAEPVGRAAAEPQFAPVPAPSQPRRDAPASEAPRPASGAAAGGGVATPRDQPAVGGLADAQARDRLSAPAGARAEEAEARSRASEAARQEGAAKQLIARDVISPDPAVRWRWDSAGIQRSRDAGATWESIPLARAADIAAASAPARDVCWLVGRGGLVLRTVDGRTFQALLFPEKVDLVGVKATDARSASVTAADGRVLTTTDGGNRWGVRP